MFRALSDELLIPQLCGFGLFAAFAHLSAFALSRRLGEESVRPTIRLRKLLRPLVGGSLLGAVVLALGPASGSPGAILESALLAVGFVGMGTGIWAGRPNAGSVPINEGELVRRLCVAGDTHEDATARIAVRLALAAGYDPSLASNLMAAASLYEVGRTGISACILNKSGSLDAEEQRTLRTHSTIGYRMLARSREPMLDLAAEMALHHHERWDGLGYPHGLAGERIPLTCRVVALAAAFDSLLEADPEQAAQPLDALADALGRQLRPHSGTCFDPALVQLLLADLPGMIAARNADAPLTAREPSVRPIDAWFGPGRFRPLPVTPPHRILPPPGGSVPPPKAAPG